MNVFMLQTISLRMISFKRCSMLLIAKHMKYATCWDCQISIVECTSCFSHYCQWHCMFKSLIFNEDSSVYVGMLCANGISISLEITSYSTPSIGHSKISIIIVNSQCHVPGAVLHTHIRTCSSKVYNLLTLLHGTLSWFRLGARCFI